MEVLYKNALVTGASSGLGRGLARWLAHRGCHVFAAARRMDRLEELKGQAPPNSVEAVSMDVADAPSTLATISKIDQTCGGLDLVVANAGIGDALDVRNPNWQRMERLISVNVTGATATLLGAISGMVSRGHGHLVGISSVAAYRGLPKNAGYCASKAFVSVFLEGLRVDLKRHGVKVTAILPGFVNTELNAKSKNPMPFLLQEDDAVDRIGRAIVRGARKYVFPWQMALLIGTARAMPDGVYDAIAPRLG
jgi:short-subunit dehydrogenase